MHELDHPDKQLFPSIHQLCTNYLETIHDEVEVLCILAILSLSEYLTLYYYLQEQFMLDLSGRRFIDWFNCNSSRLTTFLLDQNRVIPWLPSHQMWIFKFKLHIFVLTYKYYKFLVTNEIRCAFDCSCSMSHLIYRLSTYL